MVQGAKSNHLFQVSWHLIGDKLLTEPVLTQFNGTYDGLAQDCSNSSANALELPQSSAKPSIYASPNLNMFNIIHLVN